LVGERGRLESAVLMRPKADPVNPPHYRAADGTQVIDLIERWGFDANHYRATALKYLFRAGRKLDNVDDLRKAAWYINREIGRADCLHNTVALPEAAAAVRSFGLTGNFYRAAAICKLTTASCTEHLQEATWLVGQEIAGLE